MEDFDLEFLNEDGAPRHSSVDDDVAPPTTPGVSLREKLLALESMTDESQAIHDREKLPARFWGSALAALPQSLREEFERPGSLWKARFVAFVNAEDGTLSGDDSTPEDWDTKGRETAPLLAFLAENRSVASAVEALLASFSGGGANRSAHLADTTAGSTALLHALSQDAVRQLVRGLGANTDVSAVRKTDKEMKKDLHRVTVGGGISSREEGSQDEKEEEEDEAATQQILRPRNEWAIATVLRALVTGGEPGTTPSLAACKAVLDRVLLPALELFSSMPADPRDEPAAAQADLARSGGGGAALPRAALQQQQQQQQFPLAALYRLLADDCLFAEVVGYSPPHNSAASGSSSGGVLDPRVRVAAELFYLATQNTLAPLAKPKIAGLLPTAFGVLLLGEEEEAGGEEGGRASSSSSSSSSAAEAAHPAPVSGSCPAAPSMWPILLRHLSLERRHAGSRAAKVVGAPHTLRERNVDLGGNEPLARLLRPSFRRVLAEQARFFGVTDEAKAAAAAAALELLAGTRFDGAAEEGRQGRGSSGFAPRLYMVREEKNGLEWPAILLDVPEGQAKFLGLVSAAEREDAKLLKAYQSCIHRFDEDPPQCRVLHYLKNSVLVAASQATIDAVEADAQGFAAVPEPHFKFNGIYSVSLFAASVRRYDPSNPPLQQAVDVSDVPLFAVVPRSSAPASAPRSTAPRPAVYEAISVLPHSSPASDRLVQAALPRDPGAAAAGDEAGESQESGLLSFASPEESQELLLAVVPPPAPSPEAPRSRHAAPHQLLQRRFPSAAAADAGQHISSSPDEIQDSQAAAPFAPATSTPHARGGVRARGAGSSAAGYTGAAAAASSSRKAAATPANDADAVRAGGYGGKGGHWVAAAASTHASGGKALHPSGLPVDFDVVICVDDAAEEEEGGEGEAQLDFEGVTLASASPRARAPVPPPALPPSSSAAHAKAAPITAEWDFKNQAYGHTQCLDVPFLQPSRGGKPAAKDPRASAAKEMVVERAAARIVYYYRSWIDAPGGHGAQARAGEIAHLKNLCGGELGGGRAGWRGSQLASTSAAPSPPREKRTDRKCASPRAAPAASSASSSSQPHQPLLMSPPSATASATSRSGRQLRQRVVEAALAAARDAAGLLSVTLESPAAYAAAESPLPHPPAPPLPPALYPGMLLVTSLPTAIKRLMLCRLLQVGADGSLVLLSRTNARIHLSAQQSVRVALPPQAPSSSPSSSSASSSSSHEERQAQLLDFGELGPAGLEVDRNRGFLRDTRAQGVGPHPSSSSSSAAAPPPAPLQWDLPESTVARLRWSAWFLPLEHAHDAPDAPSSHRKQDNDSEQEAVEVLDDDDTAAASPQGPMLRGSFATPRFPGTDAWLLAQMESRALSDTAAQRSLYRVSLARVVTVGEGVPSSFLDLGGSDTLTLLREAWEQGLFAAPAAGKGRAAVLARAVVAHALGLHRDEKEELEGELEGERPQGGRPQGGRPQGGAADEEEEEEEVLHVVDGGGGAGEELDPGEDIEEELEAAATSSSSTAPRLSPARPASRHSKPPSLKEDVLGANASSSAAVAGDAGDGAEGGTGPISSAAAMAAGDVPEELDEGDDAGAFAAAVVAGGGDAPDASGAVPEEGAAGGAAATIAVPSAAALAAPSFAHSDASPPSPVFSFLPLLPKEARGHGAEEGRGHGAASLGPVPMGTSTWMEAATDVAAAPASPSAAAGAPPSPPAAASAVAAPGGSEEDTSTGTGASTQLAPSTVSAGQTQLSGPQGGDDSVCGSGGGVGDDGAANARTADGGSFAAPPSLGALMVGPGEGVGHHPAPPSSDGQASAARRAPVPPLTPPQAPLPVSRAAAHPRGAAAAAPGSHSPLEDDDEDAEESPLFSSASPPSLQSSAATAAAAPELGSAPSSKAATPSAPSQGRAKRGRSDSAASAAVASAAESPPLTLESRAPSSQLASSAPSAAAPASKKKKKLTHLRKAAASGAVPAFSSLPPSSAGSQKQLPAVAAASLPSAVVAVSAAPSLSAAATAAAPAPAEGADDDCVLIEQQEEQHQQAPSLGRKRSRAREAPALRAVAAAYAPAAAPAKRPNKGSGFAASSAAFAAPQSSSPQGDANPAAAAAALPARKRNMQKTGRRSSPATATTVVEAQPVAAAAAAEPIAAAAVAPVAATAAASASAAEVASPSAQRAASARISSKAAAAATAALGSPPPHAPTAKPASQSIAKRVTPAPFPRSSSNAKPSPDASASAAADGTSFMFKPLRSSARTHAAALAVAAASVSGAASAKAATSGAAGARARRSSSTSSRCSSGASSSCATVTDDEEDNGDAVVVAEQVPSMRGAARGKRATKAGAAIAAATAAASSSAAAAAAPALPSSSHKGGAAKPKASKGGRPPAAATAASSTRNKVAPAAAAAAAAPAAAPAAAEADDGGDAEEGGIEEADDNVGELGKGGGASSASTPPSEPSPSAPSASASAPRSQRPLKPRAASLTQDPLQYPWLYTTLARCIAEGNVVPSELRIVQRLLAEGAQSPSASPSPARAGPSIGSAAAGAKRIAASSSSASRQAPSGAPMHAASSSSAAAPSVRKPGRLSFDLDEDGGSSGSSSAAAFSSPAAASSPATQSRGVITLLVEDVRKSEAAALGTRVARLLRDEVAPRPVTLRAADMPAAVAFLIQNNRLGGFPVAQKAVQAWLRQQLQGRL